MSSVGGLPGRPFTAVSLRRIRAQVARHAASVLALLLLLFAFVWVAVHSLASGFGSGGNIPQLIRATLNGLTLAGLYFIVASGFTLIFGLLRVVNMGHGSFYLLGGYVGYEVLKHSSVNYWVAALVAALTVGIFGLVIQQVFLRWNQGQELRQALITIALSIVIGDQMLSAFGGAALSANPPDPFAGSIKTVYGIIYPSFRLVVLGVAFLIGLALFFLIKRTRFGMVVRAGVDDRGMTAALGVNVQVVFAVTFFVGAALAGLGGMLGGTMIALAPGQDSTFLLSSLVVVIIGGLGSLGGAVVGAVALGVVDQLSFVYLPAGYQNYSIVLTFSLLVFVLATRPQGLFGRQ